VPEALFAGGGEVGADRQEPLGVAGGAPAAGDLLLELDHPQVPLGEVVVERHPEVVGEAQHLDLAVIQAQQQVLRLGPLALGPITVVGEGGVLLVAELDDLPV